jgi:methionyl-tRNA formyltransferase
LLPAYRGAAPIQWALLDGCTETGISLMQMDEGMDTGAVYSRHPLPIPPGCDAGELTQALAELAREVLRNELIPLLRGELRAVAQDEALATAAPPIGKQHLPLIWERPAPDLENQVRALAPRPGAACLLGGRRLKILRASARREPAGAAPGSVVEISDGGPVVACGRGRLLIEVAQVEGRPARSGRDLVNGRVLSLGTRLASSEADATP